MEDSKKLLEELSLRLEQDRGALQGFMYEVRKFMQATAASFAALKTNTDNICESIHQIEADQALLEKRLKAHTRQVNDLRVQLETRLELSDPGSTG